MIKKLKEINYVGWAIFIFGIYIVILLKYLTLQTFETNKIFAIYSVLVTLYILSRFLISLFYRGSGKELSLRGKKLPTVTFVIPAKNEEDNIKDTILKIAESDYPKNKFEVVTINDGSTDNTYRKMIEAQELANRMGVSVEIVNWKNNKGKRAGMAEGVRKSNNELIVFIDSDSFVRPDTLKQLVRYFIDEKVAAVAGHAHVANANQNILTKMQEVRYFVSYRGYKAAEALFGTVTCCSGCCAAYKRNAINEVIDQWENQKFLGVNCTYGDDRSLTNYLLAKGYKALYAPEALSYTVAPDNYKQFMKQQMRWKKSWVRECIKASAFMWKRNPIMSASFYLSVILSLAAPLIVLRVIVWYPLSYREMPWMYILGLIMMAFLYGAYYYLITKDGKWIYGVMFSAFYSLVLVWQLPFAILNIRDPKWGTR